MKKVLRWFAEISLGILIFTIIVGVFLFIVYKFLDPVIPVEENKVIYHLWSMGIGFITFFVVIILLEKIFKDII